MQKSLWIIRLIVLPLIRIIQTDDLVQRVTKLTKSSVWIVLGVLFASFFSLPLTNALLGVSPVTYNVPFQPSLENDFRFYFTGDSGMVLSLSVEGDFAKYVSITPSTITGSGFTTVHLALPSEKNQIPGSHVIFIVAKQESEAAENGIALRGVVKARIVVSVPHPGKYVSMGLSVEDANAGAKAPFSLQVSNEGSDSIRARPQIVIFSETNESVGELFLDTQELLPAESFDYVGVLPTDHLDSGRYRARAVVNYEGESTTQDFQFRMGTHFVNVSNYTQNVRRGGVNRFDVSVVSVWNEPLADVYAVISVINHSLSFTTPSTTLNKFGSSTLSGYFDSSEMDNSIDCILPHSNYPDRGFGTKSNKTNQILCIAENPFYMNITLHYGTATSERIVPVYFVREINYTLIALAGSVIVLLVMLFVLLRWMHGRRGKKKRKNS